MTPLRTSATLLAFAALAACGEETKTGPERRTAAGEVLGGSITDDMLPLDTVRSQSPPLREGASGEDGGDDRDPEVDGPGSRPAREAAAARPAAPSDGPSPSPSPSETPEEATE